MSKPPFARADFPAGSSVALRAPELPAGKIMGFLFESKALEATNSLVAIWHKQRGSEIAPASHLGALPQAFASRPFRGFRHSSLWVDAYAPMRDESFCFFYNDLTLKAVMLC